MNTLLSLFAGDRSMSIRFLLEIRKTVPDQIGSLERAVQDGDLALAGRLIHGFKTQLRYTDALDLAGEAEALEQAFDREELPDAGRLEVFYKALEQWLNQISDTIARWSGSINPER